jgi:hypothetical protein
MTRACYPGIASRRGWRFLAPTHDLILTTPAVTAQPPKMIGLLAALGQATDLADRVLDDTADHDAAQPRCLHCGSHRTRLLGEYPRWGVP